MQPKQDIDKSIKQWVCGQFISPFGLEDFLKINISMVELLIAYFSERKRKYVDSMFSLNSQHDRSVSQSEIRKLQKKKTMSL